VAGHCAASLTYRGISPLLVDSRHTGTAPANVERLSQLADNLQLAYDADEYVKPMTEIAARARTATAG
jgi:hypothetical protein